ncbi:MAG TPA: hypothetical protein VFK05_03010 [Polyangiaceae bacterium]|nr:hypothetical protein [Polyangiaceae bacterium]
MNQRIVRRRRSVVGGLLVTAACGIALAPTACTIINQERDGENAGSTGIAGASGAAQGGDGAGGATAASGAASTSGEVGAGGEAGAPIMIAPPAAIVDGDVRVSCSVTCEGASHTTTSRS